MELLADSVSQAPTPLRHYLTEISARDNVPRKEKQFRNFVANSMKIPKSTVEQIWNFLKELKDRQQKEAAALKEAETKKADENASKRKAENTPKADEKMAGTSHKPSSQSTSVVENSNSKLPSADQVKKAMKKILKKEEGKAMPVKHLRKAVCAMYGVEKNGKKRMKNLLKEHLSGKKFVVDGKIVRLKVD